MDVHKSEGQLLVKTYYRNLNSSVLVCMGVGVTAT